MPNVIAVSRACLDPNADPGQPPETLRHAFWPDRAPWLEGAETLPKVAGFDK